MVASALLALAFAGADTPALKLETALYTRDASTLQVVLAFTNPTDGTLFLDCQGLPHARAQGKTLVLAFGEAGDSAAGAEVPARVPPGKLWKIERQFSVKAPGLEDPKIDLDLVRFSSVRLEVAYYPER